MQKGYESVFCAGGLPVAAGAYAGFLAEGSGEGAGVIVAQLTGDGGYGIGGAGEALFAKLDITDCLTTVLIDAAHNKIHHMGCSFIHFLQSEGA